MWLHLDLKKIIKSGEFDLHVHSTYSDGELSPRQLVNLALMRHLKFLSITDHDTIDGYSEAVEAAENTSLTIVPGIELSARYHNYAIDILGYGIEPNPSFNKTLDNFRLKRLNRTKKIIAKMQSNSIPITLDDVKLFSNDSTIGRPHIAKALVHNGVVKTAQEAFQRYLADGNPYAIPKDAPSPEEIIKLIHQHKGLAVLAHPGLINRNIELEHFIKTHNLDGIEVWHRAHKKHHNQKFLNLSEEFSLIATGGSDYHAPPHTLGKFGYKKNYISP